LSIASWKTQNAPLLFMGLGSASVLIMAAAVVGVVKTGEGSKVSTKTPTSAVSAAPSEAPTEQAPAEAAAAAEAAKKAAVKKPAYRTGIAASDLESSTGATRVGITPTEIRWGLHAPKTFDGAPLPLADAPLKGVGIYLAAINQDKVNGRVVKQYFADDRYTVEGAKGAANTILNDNKVFFVSGTLGVDQVATVAAAARATAPAPTPYMAAGGSENEFKNIGMYQIAGSYDTHLKMLADFLAKEVKTAGSPYFGLSKVGVVELDSKYIAGSVETFKQAIAANGLTWVGSVKVPKYTDTGNTHVYTAQCLDLSQTKGAQIAVPATDPLTTANMTATGGCETLKWTMSNFAHDSDTALKLFQGRWSTNYKVRGLSSGCYYNNWNTPMAAKCGQLKRAHDDWLKGNGGDEADWNKDGQGGVAGYQITHSWLSALKQIGGDPTREKFIAALNTYSNFNDLVTGPITYKGSPNLSHGVEVMAVYEAAAETKWTQLSDGLVGSF
jgi:ABC-type branched-subunit amino acid transport system substrate-binding protein